ncbi:MAG: mucoidy inhibitor MuiA family protein [Erysipelotrichaceae bacterium]|nr:mucoidy inhibitor MuiA family protein [Erysipelotrichaceae bacterium]
MARLQTQSKSVNIFRNGAEVTRTGSVELKQGAQLLQVYGLSATAQQNTVRLFSKEGVSCSDLRFEILKEEDREESREIEKEIALLQKQIESRQLQITLWQNNGDFSSRTTLGANEVQEYIEKLPERLEKLNREILDLEKKIIDLEKKLTEVREKEELPIVMAEVYVDEAGTYPFELRYHEDAAGWYPVYEIHSNAKDPLEIRMRAKINQSTTEDWKDISVSLYTGNPSSYSEVPEVEPLYLDIREREETRRKSATPMMAMGMAAARNAVMEDTEVAEESMMMSISMPQAEVRSDETMTEYVLPGNRDILKRSEGTMADLQKYTVPADYQIVAVAKADPHAYRIASVKTADLPLMTAFNASIYLKDMFTGNVGIDPDLTKENIEITLGKEERVHVSRKEVLKKTSNVLLKGQKVTEYGYETKVTNLSDEEIRITLKDQVPVSQNKEIVVDIIELSGTKPDELTGIFSKEIAVAPKQSETVKLGYKVAWPKDKKIQERRNRTYCPECGAAVTGRFCPECGTVVNS